jgi:RNA polymerase sigma factor (sigma-70 family)
MGYKKEINMRKAIISDEELLEQYQLGDESALRVLVNRHKSKIFTTIMLRVKDRALAEDIFQDTFVKVINTLKRGSYKEEGKFIQWILRIARNLVIDHFRKVSRLPMITDSEGEDIFRSIRIAEENQEDKIIIEERDEHLRKLIQALPDEQREVLIMRHYGDLSFKEIADMTGVSINTALGRMRYALNNMRKLIVKHNISL